MWEGGTSLQILWLFIGNTFISFSDFTENLHKNIVAFNFPELVSEVRITWRVDPKTLGAQDCSRLLLVDNTITQ